MTEPDIWRTSPALDPYLSRLSALLDECCGDELPERCLTCPVKKQCARWWSGISENGTVKMTEQNFLIQKSRFLGIKAKRDNGHNGNGHKGDSLP